LSNGSESSSVDFDEQIWSREVVHLSNDRLVVESNGEDTLLRRYGKGRDVGEQVKDQERYTLLAHRLSQGAIV
jgi:hypothetical protein